MIAKFVYKEELTPHTVTFWFEPEGRFDYVAGQFIELIIPHVRDAGNDRRWLTLSSSPSEELLAITTRFPKKLSSFKSALQNLRPGELVNIVEPMGDFVLPILETTPLIFVAYGIGCTPFRSMSKWIVDNSEERAITMLHGVSSADELLFRSLFSQMTDYRPFISSPHAGWHGNVGHITTETVLDHIRSDEALIYIAGPEKLVESLRKELHLKGIDQTRLIADYFPGY